MGVDYSDIERLKSAVENLNNTRDELMSKIAKELAARLLRLVVERTPKNKGSYYIEFARTYDSKTGKSKVYKNTSGKNKGKSRTTKTKITGGTLKRGWTVDNKILMFENTFVINVFNNVFYATYVEYGHRQTPGRYVPHIFDEKTGKFGKKLKKSWVPGKHMLKISTEELQKKAPAIIEKKIQTWFNEVMN